MQHFPKALIMLALSSVCITSYAQDTKTSPEQTKKAVVHHGHSAKPPAGKPPQEAITICVDKEPASQCSFQGPQELELGVCEYTPDKQYFACKPHPKNVPSQNVTK